MTEPYKSALVIAKNAQPRGVTFVEVQGFVGLGDVPIHKVGVRTNVIAEQDDALVAAHRYVQNMTAGVEAAKEDPDILSNSKTIEAIYRAFCEAKTVDGVDQLVCASHGVSAKADGPKDQYATPYPAFASPEWMRQKLTADQIATLLNIYNAVKSKESNAARADNDESVEDALMQIADASGTPFPEITLTATPREVLVKLVMVAAVKLRLARTENLTMQAEHETEVAALKLEMKTRQ